MEEEIKKLCSHVPEQTQTKEIELANEDRRLDNFIDFFAKGRKSEALSKALEETEKRVNTLQAKSNGFRKARDRLFQTSPIEWIEAKLEIARDLQKGNFIQAGEALSEFLGPITLEFILISTSPTSSPKAQSTRSPFSKSHLPKTMRMVVRLHCIGGRGRNVFEPYPYCILKSQYWILRFGLSTKKSQQNHYN